MLAETWCQQTTLSLPDKKHDKKNKQETTNRVDNRSPRA